MLLAAVLAAAGCSDPSIDATGGASTPVEASGPAAGALARGRFAGQRAARFDLLSAASAVAVRAGPLGADLYRIATPPGSGLRPVTADGRVGVRALLRPTGGSGADTVDVRLRAGVAWDLVFRAGAGDLHLDLAAAELAALTVLGATGSVRLWLPRPARTVPVVLGEHLGEAEIFVPPDVPVDAAHRGGSGYRLSCGAARLTVHR